MSELNHCRFCNCKTVTDTCKTCQQAVDAERERIIKLLEDEQRKCEQAGLFANGVELREQLQTLFIGLGSALALIKGEK